MEAYFNLFKYYKQLGDSSLKQLETEDQFFWSPSPESNSIAVIVQHLYGNMKSRWTDFLTSDGEKEWRNRDQEFELYVETKKEILNLWEEGWTCLFDALKTVNPENREQVVYIRNQGHSIDEAVQRQLAHYAYHIGQIVFIARLQCDNWHSLSIPKGNSAAFNQTTFGVGKRQEHFTKTLINKTGNEDL